MIDKTKDYILYGIVIFVLYFIFKGKQVATVSAKLGPDIIGNDKEFDYAVCGVSINVINKGLPVRVCIDPVTGIEHPIEEYPAGGSYGQIVYLRDKDQISRSNILNGAQ